MPVGSRLYLSWWDFCGYLSDFEDFVYDGVFHKMDYHMWRKLKYNRDNETQVIIEKCGDSFIVIIGHEDEYHRFCRGDESFGDFLFENLIDIKEYDHDWDKYNMPLSNTLNVPIDSVITQSTSSKEYPVKNFKLDIAACDSVANTAISCGEALKASAKATKDKLLDCLAGTGIGVMAINTDPGPSISCVIDTKVDKAEFDSKLQDFYDVTKTYLSNIKPTDSETMRALVLYYVLIDDLNYDYDLIGDNYETLSKKEANLKSSPYYVLAEKSGICTNIAQAYMFLCTQADIACGTVLHMGGSGMHMWNIVKIDDKFYYCDPTWDANTSLKYFGITAADRASWAGEYSEDGGTMLSITIPEKYEISDSRFEVLRGKLPVEISDVKGDRELQAITFVGYEYEYVFECNEAAP